ncbi:rod shape-determining protein MreD [Parasphingopyxis algicola]|uniref:rod shape-determining protein MreD n=1 Tax=Parasphingopyxis algicola TaxID=2026624 RepID=UPI0015A062F7|nr:rod shape-determining protein MreD [Parasphingopyxis algicola]QLC23841.1 rod shape-determining protein MreD [Parasphingopyxis algicola]
MNRRLHAADENLALMRTRLSLIPSASVIAGSLICLVPLVAQAPLLPPFALMIFLAWRFLRPEIWPIWAGLPFGLFDDLLSGNPIGGGMLLWTIILLALDFAENRAMWRDYWIDWLAATGALIFYIMGSMVLNALTGGGWLFWPLVPQIVATILLFPFILRLCARLDQRRLTL